LQAIIKEEEKNLSMTSNTFPKNKINKAYPLILPHYEKKI